MRLGYNLPMSAHPCVRQKLMSTTELAEYFKGWTDKCPWFGWNSLESSGSSLGFMGFHSYTPR